MLESVPPGSTHTSMHAFGKLAYPWLFAYAPVGVEAVFFDMPAAACTARVLARRDHPTIPYGRGARIVQSFADKLQVRPGRAGQHSPLRG